MSPSHHTRERRGMSLQEFVYSACKRPCGVHLKQEMYTLALVLDSLNCLFPSLQQILSSREILTPIAMSETANTFSTHDETSEKQELQNAMTFDYKKGVKNLVETSPDMTKLPSEYVLPLEGSPLLSGRAQIPVIDLNGLNGPSECRLSTLKDIKSACEIWGFFAITNHGIKESLIEETLQVVEEFFGLSLEEKLKYACEDVMSPIRYGTSLNTSRKHKLHWRDYFRHYGHPFKDSYHLWPLNPPKYRNVVKEYLEQQWEVAMKIIGAISEGLGLEKGYIQESMGEGHQILAANYYPPCPEPDKTLGLAAHSDHGGLTILTQNGVNGLQVKHNDTWFAVPHVPGTLLVNIGDFLEILSNGKYKSVEHRATVNAQQTRISIGVGHGPQLSSIIGPASPLIGENEGIQYRPITYKEYIRFQQSTPIRGKSALQVVKTI